MSVNIAELRAEINELVSLIRELRQALPDTEEKIRRVRNEYRQAISAISAYLSMLGRMNLPADVEAQIERLRRLIHMITFVYLSLAPISPWLAIPGGVSAGYGLIDAIGSYT